MKQIFTSLSFTLYILNATFIRSKPSNKSRADKQINNLNAVLFLVILICCGGTAIYS